MADLIIIVGVGGIGSNLFQKLARYAPWNYEFILIDGDTVEERNILRQCFTKSDIGKNKAECLAHKANNQIRNVFTFHPYYLNTKNQDAFNRQLYNAAVVGRTYPNNIIIFGCLDNHPARRCLEKFVAGAMKDANILYIDGANATETGDVVSVYKKRRTNKDIDGKIIGNFRSAYDYSVMIDDTNDPNNSCQELLAEGDIQTLVANDKVAVTMLEVFNNYLEGREFTGLWTFESTQRKSD